MALLRRQTEAPQGAGQGSTPAQIGPDVADHGIGPVSKPSAVIRTDVEIGGDGVRIGAPGGAWTGRAARHGVQTVEQRQNGRYTEEQGPRGSGFGWGHTDLARHTIC